MKLLLFVVDAVVDDADDVVDVNAVVEVCTGMDSKLLCTPDNHSTTGTRPYSPADTHHPL